MKMGYSCCIIAQLVIFKLRVSQKYIGQGYKGFRTRRKDVEFNLTFLLATSRLPVVESGSLRFQVPLFADGSQPRMKKFTTNIAGAIPRGTPQVWSRMKGRGGLGVVIFPVQMRDEVTLGSSDKRQAASGK